MQRGNIDLQGLSRLLHTCLELVNTCLQLPPVHTKSLRQKTKSKFPPPCNPDLIPLCCSEQKVWLQPICLLCLCNLIDLIFSAKIIREKNPDFTPRAAQGQEISPKNLLDTSGMKNIPLLVWKGLAGGTIWTLEICVNWNSTSKH